MCDKLLNPDSPASIRNADLVSIYEVVTHICPRVVKTPKQGIGVSAPRENGLQNNVPYTTVIPRALHRKHVLLTLGWLI